MRGRFGQAATFALTLTAFGCGGNGQPANGSSGGVGGSGGSKGVGGTTSSGGMSTTTSTSSTGGTIGSGGSSASGGTTSKGGTTGSGGDRSTGGNGGSSPTGGSSTTDDASAPTSTGGNNATGGSKATGGATATGGNRATGGATLAGGATGMGGAAASGGNRATGGAGGLLATGGAKASGGSTGSGGATACGTQPTLRLAADCTGRLIGVALSTGHISESSYIAAAKDFNYVTPENEMKWDAIEPTRNQFSFSGGDQIVDFAKSNGMKVKGHALVWHNQLPSWMSSLTSATDVRAAMLAHIKGVVEHYRGKVAAWDVVNEAITLDGTGLRDSVFMKYLGETFIDEAFKAARAADPDAKLYYNDYNCEGKSLKSNTVYDLVKAMKSRNVPFDGVGLQMHYGEPNLAVPTADFVANLQRYAELDLDILISEMDVHVCAGLTPTQQQAVYHDLIAACVAQPRCIAATFWGITDKYSWLNDEPDLGCASGEKPVGLLWDDNFKKKPAYTGVLNALVGL